MTPTFESIQDHRASIVQQLLELEPELYLQRNKSLPMKDARYSDERARKTAMESATRDVQAKVDQLLRMLDILADDAQYLIQKESKN